MLTFWNNVKEELDYKEMSQKELAAAAEISYNTLQSWMTKNRLPDAADSVKIAKVLGVSVEYLVTGAETPFLKQANSEINALFHDICRLSPDDLNIAKSIVRRLALPTAAR